MLGAFGSCKKGEYTGIVVDKNSSRPVTSADVYLHTSRGTPLDRNQFFVHTTTDSSGAYNFAAPGGRFEAVYAMAQGYYPDFADGAGLVELVRVPAEAPLLPVKRGRVRIDPDGTVWGFSFASGSLVSAPLADIVPIVPGESGAYIDQLVTADAGGIMGIQHDVRRAEGEYLRPQCTFLQAYCAPADGYQSIGSGEPMCFVRCRDGQHYAKFLEAHGLLSVDGSRELYFDYVYQPDGSRSLPVDFGLAEFKTWFPGAVEQNSTRN